MADLEERHMQMQQSWSTELDAYKHRADQAEEAMIALRAQIQNREHAASVLIEAHAEKTREVTNLRMQLQTQHQELERQLTERRLEKETKEREDQKQEEENLQRFGAMGRKIQARLRQRQCGQMEPPLRPTQAHQNLVTPPPQPARPSTSTPRAQPYSWSNQQF